MEKRGVNVAHKIEFIVGSIRKVSINRKLAKGAEQARLSTKILSRVCPPMIDLPDFKTGSD